MPTSNRVSKRAQCDYNLWVIAQKRNQLYPTQATPSMQAAIVQKQDRLTPLTFICVL